jgi:hypothetical protein
MYRGQVPDASRVRSVAKRLHVGHGIRPEGPGRDKHVVAWAAGSKLHGPQGLLAIEEMAIPVVYGAPVLAFSRRVIDHLEHPRRRLMT